VRGWFTDDTAGRFRAYGWDVLGPIDGHDAAAVAAALAEATAGDARPTLIICRTTIGHGSPAKAGTEAVHGAALGADEVAATRAALGWPHAPFEIPADIYQAFDCRASGAAAEAAWQAAFAAYAAAHPELAAEFERRVLRRELPAGLTAAAEAFIAERQASAPKVATRKASQDAIQLLAPLLPEWFGGSADLSGSNCTLWKGARVFGAGDAASAGDYLHYGVREFAMAAVMNGLALHGGLLPSGGTFLVFSDYSRNAIRLAALMGIPVVHVLTHDSICVGEDGPTHQPVEHTPSLRLIPGLHVWRPCDAVETAVAWQAAVERRDGPAALVLTRQNLPTQPRDVTQLAAVRLGGYVLHEPAEAPVAVIIATGSEVDLAIQAATRLGTEGTPVRVVSMPCVEAFKASPAEHKEAVLPRRLRARVAVEAASSDGWQGWVGLDGVVIGLDRYGESAPAEAVYPYLGFTVDAVCGAVRESLARVSAGG
jgi:transketolase